eukprot:CAMPEP_0184522518 /NCGR_PEP_ID=MMETSP0198_2-20121128/8323_1 /TAXON_ID=1112570 /ORGANISM="Thraustochytrium sp., Strain LLF1b" /LENGTH=232 /DNA_ID=CAMNT_0026913347 /DNA_START=335 /DNA_END=1033 /DNA_ORIENTATION=+
MTVAGVSSVTYQLTRLMLYKAAEVGAGAALNMITRSSDSVGKVQFILMELDIEAKFKSVRSLLVAIEESDVAVEHNSKDFIMVCVNNVREAMDRISATLRKIQDSTDKHANQWFKNYRSFDVVDELHLLKAQCRQFDKRLETLVQCLSVPQKSRPAMSETEIQGIEHQRILGESSEIEGPLYQEERETERMKSMLMAERALKDAEYSPPQATSRTSTYHAQNELVFEDPVFL